MSDIAITSLLAAPYERRTVSAKHVAKLADSMRDIGLINPITVQEIVEMPGQYRLLAGAHRVEAAKKLGWDKIPAHVVTLDKVDAEIALIDENLLRNELTALERAEQTARRKVLYEIKHPETRHGHNPKARKAESATLKTLPPTSSAKSFTEATADALRTSRSSVERDIRIATNLNPEAKDIVRDTPVADKKAVLDELAQVPDEMQPALAKTLVDGTGTINTMRAATGRKPAWQSKGNQAAPTVPTPSKAATPPAAPAGPAIPIKCPKLPKRVGPQPLNIEKLDLLHKAVGEFVAALNYAHSGAICRPAPIPYHAASTDSLNYMLAAFSRIQAIITPGIETITSLLSSRQEEGDGNEGRVTTHAATA